MADLRDPRVIGLKGVLFLVLGCLASALLIMELPTLKVAALLATAIWAFARCYYFAFYVIEHYIDDQFKYAGLWSFARYWLSRRNSK